MIIQCGSHEHPKYGPTPVYSARDFLPYVENVNKGDFRSIPKERFYVKMDDALVLTNPNRMIFSVQHWRPHNEYPKIKLTSKHHIGNRYVSQNVGLSILSDISEQVHMTYGTEYDKEQLWKTFFEIQNALYNNLIVTTAAYRQGCTILDYLDLYDHPEIAKSRETLVRAEQSIVNHNKLVKHILLNDPSVSKNPVIRAIRCGFAKVDQIVQIIGCRGYLTDGDSNVFPVPLTSSYLEGHVDLHDSMVESRSATKAQKAQGDPLKDSEYLNRRLQLIAQYVIGLVHKDSGTKGRLNQKYSIWDCGSDKHISIKIRPTMLTGLDGKMYLDPVTNEYEPIRPWKKELIGKVLQIRSPNLCSHRHDQNVCEMCMGLISVSLVHDANLGHSSGIKTCSNTTQLTMGIKHYDSNSSVDRMRICEHDEAYIYESEEPGHVFIHSKFRHSKVYLIFPSMANKKIINGSGIPSLSAKIDIDSLNPFSITGFKDVQLKIKDDEQDVIETITVSSGSRMGSFSHDFLKYLVNQPLHVNEDGCYEISLEYWDYCFPIFTLPKKNYNIIDYANELETFICSPSDASSKKKGVGIRKLSNYTDLSEALTDLYELVSSRMSTNFVHLEIIVLAHMRSVEPGNYDIPPLDQPFIFESYDKLMCGRSKAAAMAYEGQSDVVDNIDNYLDSSSMRHPYDDYIVH